MPRLLPEIERSNDTSGPLSLIGSREDGRRSWFDARFEATSEGGNKFSRVVVMQGGRSGLRVYDCWKKYASAHLQSLLPFAPRNFWGHDYWEGTEWVLAFGPE